MSRYDTKSQLYGASGPTSLALEQSGSILTLEMSIRSTTLLALDECVNITDKALLDALRGDTSLESSTWSISAT